WFTNSLDYTDEKVAPEIAFWVGELANNTIPVIYVPNGIKVMTTGKTLDGDSGALEYADGAVDLMNIRPEGMAPRSKALGPLGLLLDASLYIKKANTRYGGQ